MKKKLFILLVTLLFVALCINVFGQKSTYPFDVKLSGKGSKHIIFIPGFACSGVVWEQTRVLFEKEYICHTLTMAGFAGIPPHPDPSFTGWEKAIAAYLKENKVTNVTVIGHSMGGGLALALAADYPELVSKIVVVDALPCLSALMDPDFKTKESNDCSALVSKYTSIQETQFEQMQKRSMPQLLADTSQRNQVVAWSVRSDRFTFAQMYCDFSNTDLRKKIATIQCPSLILLESYFVNFKPAISDQYKNLKTADLQYASKGLHFIMYDDKEWFEKQLLSFVK